MANSIINLILTAAGYIIGLFDQMLSATGLFGWFTFCFFTFVTFRFLFIPLFGRGALSDVVRKRTRKQEDN